MSCGKTVVWCFLWLGIAATAAAQHAGVDTLSGSEPVQPDKAADTLACDGTLFKGLRPCTPVWETPVLGNGESIGRRLLLELTSNSLGEALFLVPGVHLTRTGWHGLPQVPSIRGAGAADVAVRLDGVPFSDRQLGHLDLNCLPLVGVETCEVLKGGLVSVAGSGAMAAVLDLKSLTAMPEFPESEIEAWWGSFAGRAVSLRFNRRLTGRVGILGTYENFGSGGWVDHSSAGSDRFMGKATALVGRATRIDLTGYTCKEDFERPDSCPDLGTTYAADGKNKRNLVAASIVSGDNRRLLLRYYRVGASGFYSSAGTTYVDESLLQGADLGVSWQAPDSARTALGLGCKTRRLDSSSLGDRTSTDFYVHALKERKCGRSDLQGTIRLAKTSGFDAEVAAALSGRFALREGVAVLSRLDRSYGFPAFRNLYDAGRDRPADSRIDTEVSWGFELGAELERGPLSALLSVFARNSTGAAIWVTDDSCRSYLNPDADITVVGLETSAGFRLPPWFEAEVSYWVLRARDGSGIRPANVPEQTVTALFRLGKTISRHISAGVTFAGYYTPGSDLGSKLRPCSGDLVCLADVELPGYTAALLNAHIDIDRVTVFMRIQNLLNDDLSTAWGRPRLPARSYEFGTSWRLTD